MSALCCGITGVLPVIGLGLVVRRLLEFGVAFGFRTGCWGLAAWGWVFISLGKRTRFAQTALFPAEIKTHPHAAVSYCNSLVKKTIEKPY